MNSIIGQGMCSIIGASAGDKTRKLEMLFEEYLLSSSQVSIPQEPIIRAIHRPRPGFARKRNEEEFLCLALPDT